MPNKLIPISLKEFSENLDNYFEQALNEGKEFLITNEKGDQVIFKRYHATKRKKRVRTEADYQAFLAAAGSWKDVDTGKLLHDI